VGALGELRPNENQVRWFIEWTYSPTDFFEEPLQIRHEHCELTIREGKIVAKVDPGYGDPRPTLRGQLDAELNNRFIGAQLVSAKPFKLSPASIHNQKPSGGRNTFIEFVDAICMASAHADIRIVSKDGNVICDTRTERIQRTHSLADLAAKYGRTDEVATKILQGYKNAIDDQGDLLVHLYEIRDALAKRFGGDREARRELKIEREWECLGKLANDEPLKQGRHRGRMLSGLRDATRAELDAAKTAAQTMIENYLRYIDGTL
jgi:hypothetical protein